MEKLLSQQEEVENMLYVMLGHGVGGGIIKNGKMLTGALGMAGEMGHMSISYNRRKCKSCGGVSGICNSKQRESFESGESHHWR